MKKIIDGALYNTETATLLGSDSYGYGNDFRAWTEDLYRTKSGKYFLHGEGGPMTQYAVSTGNNSWSGGSKIIPMNRSYAVEWAENHLSADEYIKLFGAVEEPESEESEQLTVYITPSMKSALREYTEVNGTTFSAVAKEAFADFLKKGK